MPNIDTKGMFARRVLRCVGEQSRTQEEIEKAYRQMYPPARVTHYLKKIETRLFPRHKLPDLRQDVRQALELLCKEGCLRKTRTHISDFSRSEGTVVYTLTDIGRKEK